MGATTRASETEVILTVNEDASWLRLLAESFPAVDRVGVDYATPGRPRACVSITIRGRPWQAWIGLDDVDRGVMISYTGYRGHWRERSRESAEDVIAEMIVYAESFDVNSPVRVESTWAEKTAQAEVRPGAPYSVTASRTGQLYVAVVRCRSREAFLAAMRRLRWDGTEEPLDADG